MAFRPLKNTALCLCAVSTLALSAACAPRNQDDPRLDEARDEAATPSVADARAFIDRAETELAQISEYNARIAWVQATYINHDTNWLVNKADAEGTELGVRLANEAKRFDGVTLPADLARKMQLLKLGLNLPAPERDGAASELAMLSTRMGTTYATGKIELGGKEVVRNDLESMMGTIRDPELLEEIWTKWRDVPVAVNDSGTDMKQDYAAMVALSNEGARELGFENVGDMWRARYDMPADAFVVETDRLWAQVKPLYDELHCHVRARLNDHYGDDIVPLDQPIRADLLGNMWGQSWGNIYDLVAPNQGGQSFDLTKLLVENDYDAVKMTKAGEAFFSSLGFDPLPDSFWARSQFTKPADREVVCHASAWSLDSKDDIRIKMCTKVSAEDFRVIHHELGHNYYQRAYKDKAFLFQNGANGGFHEAIGDMIALSITPEYLNQIGLLSTVPDADQDLDLLMQQALEKIAFMPFGLLMDKWRWQVFGGELTPRDL